MSFTRSLCLIRSAIHLLVGLFVLVLGGSVHAAGAVEMQVERIIDGAISEYNQGMESGDPQGWLKYFTDNVKRESPLSSQQGRAQFDEHYRSEFNSFKVQLTPKRKVVSGRSIAVLFDWEGTHRPSGAPIKVEMAAFFEVSTSGRFDSVAWVFDPTKLAKLVADK